VKKKDRFEPGLYLPSKSDPRWKRAESGYIWENIRQRIHHRIGNEIVRDPGPFFDARHRYANSLYQQVVQGTKFDSLPPSVSTQAEEAVIKALKEFGPVLGEYELFGALFWEIIDYWQWKATEGSREEMLHARKRLKEAGKALIPESRGRGGQRRHPTDVRYFYLSQLFVLYHVRHALRSGVKTRSQKVKEASQRYGVPIEIIREYWGLDDEDSPYRQPLTLKDMARELTAQHFRITHQTVQNTLSS